MIEPPEIVETDAQLMAYVHLTIPREAIRQAMDPGLSEIFGALADQEIEPSGVWFTHHLRMVPEIFDFEICVPVKVRVKPVGRVQPGEWPAMTVARAVYAGPYGGLPKAWKDFNDWISASNFTAGEDRWERYISGPPLALRTELYRAVTPKIF